MMGELDNITVTVWVMEHDDPEVAFVINSRSEMEENFGDLLDEMNGPIKIRLLSDGETRTEYDADILIRRADPIAWEQEFIRYCQGWTEMEMPFDLYFSEDDAARLAWVAEHVND